MLISFVKKYIRLLSVSCRVGDLSLSFNCRVDEKIFVCQFLSASWLSVSSLSVSCRSTELSPMYIWDSNGFNMKQQIVNGL